MELGPAALAGRRGECSFFLGGGGGQIHSRKIAGKLHSCAHGRWANHKDDCKIAKLPNIAKNCGLNPPPPPACSCSRIKWGYTPAATAAPNGARPLLQQPHRMRLGPASNGARSLLLLPHPMGLGRCRCTCTDWVWALAVAVALNGAGPYCFSRTEWGSAPTAVAAPNGAGACCCCPTQ